MSVRIGTMGQNALLQSQMMRLQERSAESQRQIATGYKSADYAGLGGKASSLINAQDLEARLKQQESVNATLKVRLEVTAQSLQVAGNAVQTFRDEVLKALSTGDGSQLRAQGEAMLSSFGAALNTQLDGQYLFGGGRTDAKPVVAGTLADVAALPTIADGFANGPLLAQATVDEGVTLTYGVAADTLGEPFLQIMRDFADFDASVDGPVGFDLTPDQRTFLEGLITGLDGASRAVRAAETSNGLNQKRLNEATETVGARKDYLTDFIGGIQDADMAEAIARLNQDKTALEAAYNVVGNLGKLSLLNFI